MQYYLNNNSAGHVTLKKDDAISALVAELKAIAGKIRNTGEPAALNEPRQPAPD